MVTDNVASAPATRFWVERGPKDWARVLPAYWEAGAQAHRQSLIAALRDMPRFETLRELGCCAGTNLRLIRQVFPWVRCQGIEIAQEAVLFAQEKFLRDGSVGILHADMLADAPYWQDGEADVVVSCYTLAYVSPEDLPGLMKHIVRSARLGIVLIEPMIGETGRIKGFNGLVEWRHDYTKVLDVILSADPRPAKLESVPLPTPVEACDGAVRVIFVNGVTGENTASA